MAIDLDKNRLTQTATVENDTILFRIVYQKFATQSKLLNGQGGRWTQGRYNFRESLTSYVADNVLLCIAESLYHLSRQAALHLRDRHKGQKSSVDFWRSIAATDKILVAFKSNVIKNLIYIDSQDCRYHVATKAGKVLHPSTVLNPDFIYKPLQQVAKLYRKSGKRGIVYPSSRHVKDWAIALFGNHRTSLNLIVARLKIRLSLIDEENGKLADDPQFDPFSVPISYNKGYYSFDHTEYQSLKNILIPANLAESGYIDLVRRKYSNYPTDAVSTTL